MKYVVLALVLWTCLFGSNGWAVAGEGASGNFEMVQERPGITDADEQEPTADQVQPPSNGRLTKEQVRAVIRARRERVRAEMKARRELLRAEGAEIQQEIMAKKARIHMHHKEAAEVIVQPAN